ncbi:hypothetical protein BOTBODRAFT_117286 [Botryobasidium botryosum FD-172 SS1]|uniref:NADP-dependent oxidoreductase domain-containing protein n=1 Tax=Botryobasidium botryosum (strain FD-172 SS1) TaxID=930990 RepID=A0A067M3T4_BOTB1|nr:hypothetical protein BOTBODRAFT_117286 [Botryobasidium botryosum FD-172 SS1]
MPSRVPLLYGTGGFGVVGTETRIHEPAQAQELVDVFVKHGYSRFDTARYYGQGTSEKIIAQLDLKGATVDTKIIPLKPGDHAPARLRELFAESVEALGPYKIRVLYLHAPDRSVPIEDTLRAVNELHKEGKFEAFGLSNFFSWEVAEIVTIAKKNGWIPPTFYQGTYSALDRSVEYERLLLNIVCRLIPCLRKFGIRFVAYSTMAGGYLTGKLLDAAPTPGSHFDSNTKWGAWYHMKYDHLAPLVKDLKELAAKHNLRLGQVALRWLQHHSILTPEDGGAILGASSAQQLEQSILDSEEGPLPEEIVNALDEAWKKAKAGAAYYARA